MKYTRTSNHRNTIYVATIKAPGTSEWSARLQLPTNHTQRLAETDGRCRPLVEVSKGLNGRYKYLHEANLPARLEPQLEQLIEQVTAEEHQQAERLGLLPISRERRDFYREHGATIDLEDIARAETILEGMRAFATFSPEMVRYAAELATETVYRDFHDDVVEEAQDELRSKETEVAELDDELSEAKRDRESANAMIKKAEDLADDLDSLIERLGTRNLIGAYGRDDFEKIIDLMQPISEAGWAIANDAA